MASCCNMIGQLFEFCHYSLKDKMKVVIIFLLMVPLTSGWWPFDDDEEEEIIVSSNTQLPKGGMVPFEMNNAEQKFLQEANQFLNLSPLDKCQHRVCIYLSKHIDTCIYTHIIYYIGC